MRIGRARPRLDAEALQARRHGLEQAVAVADGRLSPDAVAQARGVLARTAQRLELAGDLTVVALAGSTGAGKSSVFNAIAGAELAGVAATRPTTQRPSAALWTSAGQAGGLLDWLEVPRWHEIGAGPDDPLDGLVLLDLPDHDSTVVEHRERADRIVERADVMIWVMDPQKYGDALVHDAYLRRYARHADVTLVVLNQADRLAEADVAACVAHLRTLVAADGLPDARILPISARTGAGLPELRAAIAEVVAQRQAAISRLAADVSTASDGLAASAADDGRRVQPTSRQVRDRLPDAMADAAGVPLVEAAVAESVRRTGTLRTGWPVSRWVRRLRADPAARLRLGQPGVDPGLVRTSLPSASPVALAEVSSAARAYAQAATEGCPPAWVRSARAIAVANAEGIGPGLDQAVARAEVRHPAEPFWWRAVGALQWLLLATMLAGILWLVGLWLVDALALIRPDPPTVGRIPWPTLLAIGGLVGGLLVALLARIGTAATARRAAARARAAVTAEVEKVARDRIIDPVDAEVATVSQFRLGMIAARGG